MMSQRVNIRLREDQLERLKRCTRAFGKTPSETAALLVDERLREAEFAFIEFCSSPRGRQAYLKGLRLTVWWVVKAARQFDGNAQDVANHFERPLAWIKAALNYYRAFPSEIDQAIADAEKTDFKSLQRALPNARLLTLDLNLSEGTR